MTEEQVVFYTIGKLAVICGLSFLGGWAIVTTSEAIKDSLTILSAKAKAIRQGKD